MQVKISENIISCYTAAPLIFVSQVARTSSSRRHTIYNAWGSFVRPGKRLFDISTLSYGAEPPIHMHIYCSLLGEVLATRDTKLIGSTVVRSWTEVRKASMTITV